MVELKCRSTTSAMYRPSHKWSAARRRAAPARSRRPFMRWLLVVSLLLASVFPTTSFACSCLQGVPVGTIPKRPYDQPWLKRDAVFMGYVLSADQHFDSVSNTITRTVRLVTEVSWHGALPDTVTLSLGADAPCAFYSVGYRYLVFAGWDARQSGRLTTERCDDAWGLSGGNSLFTQRFRASMGSPNWFAPPMGSRSIDRHTRPLGTPLPRSKEDGSILFYVAGDSSIVRLEIGDLARRRIPGYTRPIASFLPGLYQVRVTWSDGAQFSGYVSIECEFREGELGCTSARDFRTLKNSPSWK